jgi:biopolymer transport protein ExbB
MNGSSHRHPADRRPLPGVHGLLLCVAIALWVLGQQRAVAQQAPGPAGPSAASEEAQLDALANPEVPSAEPATDVPSGIDLITLIGRGGAFMWPIGVMSLLVVTLAVERIVSFRRRRMMPRGLVRRLQQLVKDGDGALDAEAALRACREHRSVTGNVVTAMLTRVGRPVAEIEQAASETAQREADGQAGPIRWLHLAAAATPLMGLLGTVWGMIVAFHNSTTLTADRSRSEQLSEGIYTALVTTLAGLAVAIPAAILAQYLENRLTKIFHRIEKLAFALAPALQHYTGRVRMDADQRLQPFGNGAPPTVAPPVMERSGEAKSAPRRRAGGDPQVTQR